MKESILKKVTSRKFFALLSALVVAVLVAYQVDEGTIAHVTAIIGAFASIVTYITAEAYIDGKNTKE
jgi:flagellar biosynthesis protein FliQ